jgi:hypothetical protein
LRRVPIALLPSRQSGRRAARQDAPKSFHPTRTLGLVVGDSVGSVASWTASSIIAVGRDDRALPAGSSLVIPRERDAAGLGRELVRAGQRATPSKLLGYRA